MTDFLTNDFFYVWAMCFLYHDYISTVNSQVLNPCAFHYFYSEKSKMAYLISVVICMILSTAVLGRYEKRFDLYHFVLERRVLAAYF